jgi:signal transduction histidine kinase
MADDQKRIFSLVRLSFVAMGVFAIASVLTVVALMGVRHSSEKAVGAWRQFADQASIEQRALRAFVTQAGAGGMVEEYNRLTATGDETLVPMVYGRGGAALGALQSYPIEGATDEEIKARETLLGVMRAYMVRVAPIVAMHRAGRSSADIIKAAQVGDQGAKAALQVLADETADSMVADTTLPDSKSLILLDIRRFIGLEGLIHHADRYLVGGEEEALQAVRGDVESIEAAMVRYGAHPVTAAETVLLARLSTEVDAFEQRLVEARSAGLLATNSRGIQAALVELEKGVYADAMVAQDNLQSTLTDVSNQTAAIILVVAVGAFILIAGGIWLFWFRIGRRVHSITTAMRELAAGRLDAEIPASNDRDEIGEMSQALLVFRDGLRANATLTTELAESSRLASLGAMVAGMAHELNTPIGNALAVASTLEDQCKTFKKDLASERILRSTLERHASSLEDASMLIQRNLVRAADQIGSFKQVAVDQTSGRRREFHLDDVLGSVIQSMHPLFKRTPFTLSLGEASGVVMDSYPGAFSQVVTNLIENGLKHGLAGKTDGKVEVAVRRLGPQFTEVVVTDNGVGISDDIKPRIFQAFFTTMAGKGGSGLGLHIVKSIVCGPLGGQISVQSEAGGGSRFIITLPNKAPAEGLGAEATERTYYAAAQHAA